MRVTFKCFFFKLKMVSKIRRIGRDPIFITFKCLLVSVCTFQNVIQNIVLVSRCCWDVSRSLLSDSRRDLSPSPVGCLGSDKVCSYHDILDHLNLTRDNEVYTSTRPVLDHTHLTLVRMDLALYAILAVVSLWFVFLRVWLYLCVCVCVCVYNGGWIIINNDK